MMKLELGWHQTIGKETMQVEVVLMAQQKSCLNII